MQPFPRQNGDSAGTELDYDKIYVIDPYILINILLETASYGIFLILFLLSTVLLLRRRRALLHGRVTERVKLRNLLFYLMMSMLMFLAITAKWTFWWAEVLPIPNYHGPDIVAQLPRLGRTEYRMKGVCIRITVLLGDIIAIYRLWILSSRNKAMIAFPVVGFLGFVACAIELSGRARGVTNSLIPIEHGSLRTTGWHIGAITCTTSITVYCTLMIAWIITRARMCMGARVLGHGLKQVLAVVIESAALYTVWNLFFFVTGIGLRSRIALAFLDCVPAVYGISVMLINVRVGLGWERDDEHYVATAAPAGVRNRRSFPVPREQEGAYISTEAYTELSGRSHVQSSGEVEHEDPRSIASSASATASRHSGSSEVVCGSRQSLQ